MDEVARTSVYRSRVEIHLIKRQLNTSEFSNVSLQDLKLVGPLFSSFIAEAATFFSYQKVFFAISVKEFTPRRIKYELYDRAVTNVR